MADKIPTTLDELQLSYGTHIKSFIDRQFTRYSRFSQLRDDFEQELYLKFLQGKTLQRYNPSKASFKTFLDKVMLNAFFSFIKKNRSVLFSDLKNNIDQFPDPPYKIALPDEEQGVMLTEPDLQLIIGLINRIPKIEERLLVKLKFYCRSIPLSNEEMGYIAQRLTITADQVPSALQEMRTAKKENAIGIRNSDICRILPYRPGSVSTLFERLVRKYLRQQYIYMKTSPHEMHG